AVCFYFPGVPVNCVQVTKRRTREFRLNFDALGRQQQYIQRLASIEVRSAEADKQNDNKGSNMSSDAIDAAVKIAREPCPCDACKAIYYCGRNQMSCEAFDRYVAG